MGGGSTKVGGNNFGKNKKDNKSKMKDTTTDKEMDIVKHGDTIATPKKLIS
jgi:hypothetical protein